MSAFSVENPHDDKTFENYSRFEWGVEVGVVTTFMLRLFVPHEFDMQHLILPSAPSSDPHSVEALLQVPTPLSDVRVIVLKVS